MIQNILTAITGILVLVLIVYRLVRLWKRKDSGGGCSGCSSKSDCALSSKTVKEKGNPSSLK
ncbi:virus attachment protein p12 family protein [Porphyromonas sp. COT-052 OH4946]|uniref:FeoB-associated Cys-rich membrane protein n=1 Tax=Porphyromonas sp. COT-052 OH4946 TaxID=1515618 RepID=UPI00051D79C6|nr:FeoB-associated Cys-rich membrane protein [Porphyromonas sp. COT-052 OH4946]KGL56198.1 virus attachment protein p12 family protein [Porphyromonas sp. COT-052 OH4946]